MSKIEIKDLYLIFGHEKQKALKMLKKDKSKEEILKDTGCTVGVKDANLSINEGEFFVIMGLSGSGKSTLLRCINRLIRPTAGQVLVNGVDISKISEKELLQVRRKELAMVFQNFGLLPHRSVLSNIAFGLELQGVKKEEREKKEKPLRNADNRIPFNFHGLLVNQKASYMFTAPPLFNLGNKNANKALVKFLGDKSSDSCANAG